MTHQGGLADLKSPLGGVPPPLVFEVGRFVAWKEVLKDCVVKLGGLFKSWVMRGFWGGSGQVLDESWARPVQLLAILVGFWEALGLSWALLGRLWRSWEALWVALGQLLDALGQILGAPGLLLGGSGSLLGAKLELKLTPRGAKSSPRPSKIEAKMVQHGLDMSVHLPNSILRASRRNFGAILSEVGAPGGSKIVKKLMKNQYFIFFLEGHFVAQDAPKRREGRTKMARRHKAKVQGED